MVTSDAHPRGVLGWARHPGVHDDPQQHFTTHHLDEFTSSLTGFDHLILLIRSRSVSSRLSTILVVFFSYSSNTVRHPIHISAKGIHKTPPFDLHRKPVLLHTLTRFSALRELLKPLSLTSRPRLRHFLHHNAALTRPSSSTPNYSDHYQRLQIVSSPSSFGRPHHICSAIVRHLTRLSPTLACTGLDKQTLLSACPQFESSHCPTNCAETAGRQDFKTAHRSVTQWVLHGRSRSLISAHSLAYFRRRIRQGQAPPRLRPLSHPKNAKVALREPLAA